MRGEYHADVYRFQCVLAVFCPVEPDSVDDYAVGDFDLSGDEPEECLDYVYCALFMTPVVSAYLFVAPEIPVLNETLFYR